MPIMMSVNGTQAVTGIGRIRLIVGSNIAEAIFERPINTPNGTPMSAARPKPLNTRTKLAYVCFHNIAEYGSSK